MGIENKKKIAVIGAGVTGLAIAETLKEKEIRAEVTIYEKSNRAGGLCQSFCLQNAWYDLGAHCEFAKDPYVRNLMEKDVEFHTSKSESLNYKKGKWIKNPVQNNLYPLELEEKIKIIKDFAMKTEGKKAENYAEWLCQKYGNYFALNYPFFYTRKYWTVEPDMLETDWIGPRMYTPSLEEILRGAMQDGTPNVHYSGEIRYPYEGGFERFIRNMIDSNRILYRKELISIDPDKNILYFQDQSMAEYDEVVLTTPLNEAVNYFKEVPDDVCEAADKLDYTSLVLVSLLISKSDFMPAQSIYIYDEETYAARIYCTDLYAGLRRKQTPLQAEIYYSKYKPRTLSLKDIKENLIDQLSRMELISTEDVIESDVREIKYANVLFTHGIYENRKMIHKFLDDKRIYYAGRFGEWEYLWSDQSVLSGVAVANKMISQTGE